MEQTTNEAVVQKNPGGARLKKGGRGPLVALGIVVGVLWGLLLNALWLSFYMGKSFWAWTVAKAPLKLLLVPVFAYLIYLVLKGLQKTDLAKHL